jgi:hypothetical protein
MAKKPSAPASSPAFTLHPTEVEELYNASIKFASEGMAWHVAHLLALEAPEAILEALAEGAQIQQNLAGSGHTTTLRTRPRGRLEDLLDIALGNGQVHLNAAAMFLRDETQFARTDMLKMLDHNLMTPEERQHIDSTDLPAQEQGPVPGRPVIVQ